MDEELGALIAEAIRLVQEILCGHERGFQEAAGPSHVEKMQALGDTLDEICDLLEPEVVEEFPYELVHDWPPSRCRFGH